jgi:hypothetical protein
MPPQRTIQARRPTPVSFDIPQIHISDNSLEAQAVEQVMRSKHVGAEEAVRSILRKSVRAATSERNFIKEAGACSKILKTPKFLMKPSQ